MKYVFIRCFSIKIIRNSIVSAVNTLTKKLFAHMQITSTDIENISFEIGAIFLSFELYANLSIIIFLFSCYSAKYKADNTGAHSCLKTEEK